MRCLSEEGLALLANGATAVTPRPFQTGTISRQFVAYAASRGQKSWQRPAVLTTYAWLSNLWKGTRALDADPPTLLSPAQEAAVWQEIIERDNPALIEIGKTVRDVRTASLRCAEYQISFSDQRWGQDADAEKFLKWHTDFQRRCVREHWITMASAWSLLPEWIASEDRSGQGLVLTGFSDRPPALEAGLRAWQSRGGALRWEDLSPSSARPRKIACDRTEAEITRAAQWARALAERGETSIGVIVPRLDEVADKVVRIFDDVFYPSHLLDELDREEARGGVYQISATPRLRTQPLVASALLVLDITSEPMRVTDASAFLRSPFWKGAMEERHRRALAELKLRRTRSLDTSRDAVKAACKDAPIARSFFQDLGLFLLRSPLSAEFPYWAKFITELLKLAGWPGAELPPGDQPAMDAWQNAISELASLGAVSGVVTRPRAFAALRRLLGARGPGRGAVSSPVQVLDADEAEGVHFDHLWVTGLSPDSWRPPRSAVGFVPLPLLREAGFPGTSAARRRADSRKSLDRLLGSAPDVVVSFAGSPLSVLDSIDTRPDETLPVSERPVWGSLVFSPAIMDQMEDSDATHPKGRKIRGGTSLIKYQSLCPFRAFAQIRLSAADMMDGTFGFDHLDRGNFLHRVLEGVWGTIGSQEKLKRIPDDELKAIVEEAIRNAVGPLQQESAFDRELTQAEHARLLDLTLEWLALEKKRLVPFEVVHVEEGRTLETNGLTIDLRLDRIDRLDDGKLLLIDYKTGKRKLEDLDGERPAEPQMLVYATALGEEVEGILFGLAIRRESTLVGYARKEQLHEKKCVVLGDQWPARRRDWEGTVRRLADEFRLGQASVDPARGACQYCHLKALCRVREVSSMESEAEA